LENYTNKPFLSELGGNKALSKSFAKINAISDFANKGHSFTANLSSDFQVNYGKNPGIFRRSKGAMSEFANGGAKHAFISSPFGRR
jgi:hypothetical protein